MKANANRPTNPESPIASACYTASLQVASAQQHFKHPFSPVRRIRSRSRTKLGQVSYKTPRLDF
eukprot:scaffold297050_cov47-Prasinocladus_malaysianus.AAC.1